MSKLGTGYGILSIIILWLDFDEEMEPQVGSLARTKATVSGLLLDF